MTDLERMRRRMELHDRLDELDLSIADKRRRSAEIDRVYEISMTVFYVAIAVVIVLIVVGS